MKIYILFVIVFLSSCFSSKESHVKVPKYPKEKWFTKRSLKEFCDDFSKKDWSSIDTISISNFDSLVLKNSAPKF